MTAFRDGDASTASPVGDGELDGPFAAFHGYCRIALAVSGGADSMALMRLAHAWWTRADHAPSFVVLTVDHGLRAAAATEAEWVKSQAAALGLTHHTLIWTGSKPATGVQAKARAARYALMTAFCREHAIPALATAHTADDQAETLIMRLARGSGVDGLSAMAARSAAAGVDILRPLLGLPRVRLVAGLLAHGQSWVEDPSNDDEHYERVRVRRGLRHAAGLGLSSEALALAARRLQRARDALEDVTGRFLREALISNDAGYGEIALTALFGAPEEIALRALSRVACAFGGRSDPPRLSKLEAVYAALRRGGRGATLSGCRFAVRRGALLAAREFGRMEAEAMPLRAGDCVLWDRRFAVRLSAREDSAGGAAEQFKLRPLGPDGVATVARLRGTLGVIPRVAAVALPSLWQGDRLVHVPFVEWREGAPADWLAGCEVKFVGADWPASNSR